VSADRALRQLTCKIETMDRLSAVVGNRSGADRKHFETVLRDARQAAAAGDAGSMAKAQREMDLILFRLCED
jgi:hypothetical protein